MKKIVLATKNKYKVEEIKKMLFGFDVEVDSLMQHPDIPDVVEDMMTFEENAKKKALHTAGLLDCFALADDSGLVVKELEGRPGVHSARYAGIGCSYKDNTQKLLLELKKIPDERRQAEFVCCMVCASPKKQTWTFVGKIAGMIATEEKGEKGFGYDPIFIPEGQEKTFAEMDPAEKNKISHRGLALKKFKFAIQDIFGSTNLNI